MKRTLTEAQKNMYRTLYYHKAGRSLIEAYGRPSENKKAAYMNCLAEMLDDGGYNSTILSHNQQIFVFGYIKKGCGVENLVVITPYNKYEFPLRG